MTRNLNNVSNFYQINFPNFDATVTPNITFNSKVGSDLFSFTFRFNVIWRGWCTMPDGSIRQLGIIPNVLNWSRFQDWSLMFLFSGQSIGQLDLINSTMVVLQWQA